jgi:hypothetical protein
MIRGTNYLVYTKTALVRLSLTLDYSIEALPSDMLGLRYRGDLSRAIEADLRTEFPHYETLPDGVKMALLDMIYNLGPAGLFKDFPHLIASIDAGAWAQAAEQCMRRGPSAARNAWTREQFLTAVVTTIQAEAESWLKRIWRRIRQTLDVLLGRRP